MKIIYLQDSGVAAVVHPPQDLVDAHGIDAVALALVPVGKPFKIVEDSTIPSDRSMRGAWTADPVLLDDGVGAEYDTIPEGDPA